MFLKCTPEGIVAVRQASYIRETQPPFEAEGPSIGQAAEAILASIATFRAPSRPLPFELLPALTTTP